MTNNPGTESRRHADAGPARSGQSASALFDAGASPHRLDRVTHDHQGRPIRATPQGRFQFPDVPGPKLNLGCGPDVRPRSEGWWNMDDAYVHPEVDRHDVTDVPWPYEDASFDLVYASHVLEHVAPSPGRDPLLRVFEEAHRVLKPQGRMVVRVPWGDSHASVAHVQHYRRFFPEHFFYFQPEHTEHYIAGRAAFRVTSWERTRETVSQRLPHALRVRGIPLTSHLLARFPWMRRVLTVASELEVHLVRVDDAGRP